MRYGIGPWLAGLALAAGSLAASASLWAQTPAPAPLTQLVRPTPGQRPLGAVLRELARQGGLPLSYSSSLVPLAHRCQVRPGPPRPLGEVLREVLGAEHLRYGLLAGQLVLWPDQAAAPPGVRLPAAPRGAGEALTAPNPLPAGPVAATGRAASLAKPSARAAGQQRAGLSQPQAVLRGRAAPPNPDYRPALSGSGGATSLTLAGRTGYARAAATRAVTTPDPRSAEVARPIDSRLPAGRVTPREGRPPTAESGILGLRQPQLLIRAAGLPAALSPVAGAAGSRPAPAPDQPGLPRLRGLYLHGEAWASESLPVGLTGKVGLTRAYLVLGVAAGPFDHLAWGLGLGTAGRARGRFTPSLEVVEWFVAGPDHAGGNLTQLRPQLAWQLRRQGRLALLAGPTFNLALADNHGPSRDSFGQHQWLWVDESDGRQSVRLWPGIQVGLQF